MRSEIFLLIMALYQAQATMISKEEVEAMLEELKVSKFQKVIPWQWIGKKSKMQPEDF